jgi:ribosomal protein S12 methylthiotransferase accessory factor YcaO
VLRWSRGGLRVAGRGARGSEQARESAVAEELEEVAAEEVEEVEEEVE